MILFTAFVIWHTGHSRDYFKIHSDVSRSSLEERFLQRRTYSTALSGAPDIHTETSEGFGSVSGFAGSQLPFQRIAFLQHLGFGRRFVLCPRIGFLRAAPLGLNATSVKRFLLNLILGQSPFDHNGHFIQLSIDSCAHKSKARLIQHGLGAYATSSWGRRSAGWNLDKDRNRRNTLTDCARSSLGQSGFNNELRLKTFQISSNHFQRAIVPSSGVFGQGADHRRTAKSSTERICSSSGADHGVVAANRLAAI